MTGNADKVFKKWKKLGVLGVKVKVQECANTMNEVTYVGM